MKCESCELHPAVKECIYDTEGNKVNVCEECLPAFIDYHNQCINSIDSEQEKRK